MQNRGIVYNSMWVKYLLNIIHNFLIFTMQKKDEHKNMLVPKQRKGLGTNSQQFYSKEKF